MPTYQYACTECDHRFEQVQSFTDDALTECPVCAGRLRKVFNAVGVVFKGSGFYRNDSRAGEAPSDSPKTDAPKSDSTKSDATKSDSTTSGSTKSEAGKSGSRDASSSSRKKSSAAS